jgi:hypothetical protein
MREREEREGEGERVVQNLWGGRARVFQAEMCGLESITA